MLILVGLLLILVIILVSLKKQIVLVVYLISFCHLMRGLGPFLNRNCHLLVAWAILEMASQAESDSTSQNEGEAEDSSLFSRCVYAKQDSEAVAGKKKRYLHSLHVDMYTKLGGLMSEERHLVNYVRN